MTFLPGQAAEVLDIKTIGMYSRAFRSKGKRIVLLCLTDGFHAGHAALIRAARRIPGAVVIVAANPNMEHAVLAQEHVDVVFRYTDDMLWPTGRRTNVSIENHGLEPVAVLEPEVTRIAALCGVVKPTDLFIGEKDYELVIAVNRMVADFHLGLVVHSHPTIRTADGVPVSLSSAEITRNQRDQAVAMSAALVAGAHAAEGGPEAVLAAARAVLLAAQITPEYLELRSLTLEQPPKTGNARLLVAANIGGTRLLDNVGVPVGIGFKNIEKDREAGTTTDN